MAENVAKQILQLLLQAGVAGASSNPLYRLASSGADVRELVGNMSGKQNSSVFMADGYPTEFTPGINHVYDILDGVGNVKSGDKDAARMQSLDEHNNAITKYLRPGMNPKEAREAIMRGREYERNLPSFWNDSKTREGHPYHASSSAVDGVRLTPDGRVEVRWRGGGKWYTFKQYPNTYEASKAAQKLLTADSIGVAVMPFQRKGKFLEFKDKSKPYSSWNRPNYDGAFA